MKKVEFVIDCCERCPFCNEELDLMCEHWYWKGRGLHIPDEADQPIPKWCPLEEVPNYKRR